MALETRIAGDVVTQLAAAALSHPATPRFVYVPSFDLTADDGICLQVAARERLLSNRNRRATANEISVDIGVTRKLSDAGDVSNELADQMADFSEEVQDFWSVQNQPTSGVAGVSFLRVERPILYSPELFEQRAIWFAVVSPVFWSVQG